MKREEIRIRDPFILPYEGRYYMFGTGTPGAEDIDMLKASKTIPNRSKL